MKKRFQGRYVVTGEAVGVPQDKATAVVALLRREGFNLSRCEVEMYTREEGGEWRKDVSCPALAVR